MEFLNPAALTSFFLLPLLVIPYLIKGRRRRVVFSSLLLFRGRSAHSLAKPWRRLLLPPIFFLQLLLLLLLVLALLEPVFSVRPLKVALVLDNSASMQAREGQKSRLEMAKEEARGLVQGATAKVRFDLFRTTPKLEKVGKGDLPPKQAVALLDEIVPYDLAEPSLDYSDELSRLAEKGYDRLYFLTDYSVRSQGGKIRAVTVGRPKDNLAVTSLRLSRPSFSSSQLEAAVEVASFSSRQEKVKVALKAGAKVLSTKSATVPARQRATVSFEGLPASAAYEAELDVDDGLALDNRRFAVLPPSGELDILGISPRPEALRSLGSIPGVNLTLIRPEAYEKERGRRPSLEIYQFSAPAALPQNNALFVLPPRENPLVAQGKALSRPTVSSWSEPHPLTHYVNFALFRPSYARPLRPLSFGQAIIESPEGALALAVEQRGFRYLVLGFDPFPYLGRENLPVSIFTLNLLNWFYQGLGSSGTATGEPLFLGGRQKGWSVVTPKGEKLPLPAGQNYFARTFFQGLYQVVRGGDKEWFAVNFDDAGESDLSHASVINLRQQREASEGGSFLFSLWPYLLLLALFLLVLEWFLNPPATQR